MCRMIRKAKWLKVICFMFISAFFTGTDIGAEEAEIDTSVFEYERSPVYGQWDGTYTITKYNGTDETVIIPSEIDGKKIKRIGDLAFEACETIKHLIVQEGISEIGLDAFDFCKNLETVTLPEGITDIEYYAFNSCEKLKKINIPNTVEKINDGTFYKCKSLQAIKLPESIIEIGDSVFACCSDLSFIEIPDGLVSIGDCAFCGCDSLTDITLPDTIKYIRQNAFQSCIEYDNGGFAPIGKVLKNLVIHANADSFARVYAKKYNIKFRCLNFHDWNEGIITINPTLINKGQKTFTCIACNLKKTEEVPKLDLPQKGRKITDDKSKNTYKVNCPAIQNGTVEFTASDTTKRSITIPESVIIDGAVYKVTSVSKNAFKNNKKIKKVTIGKNVKTIGSNTFSGCKNLRTIIVKSKQIKTVGKNAFKGIHSKAEIKVPKKKLKSYRKMFSKKGLKDSVKIIK